jgi:hypothetical protein
MSILVPSETVRFTITTDVTVIGIAVHIRYRQEFLERFVISDVSKIFVFVLAIATISVVMIGFFEVDDLDMHLGSVFDGRRYRFFDSSDARWEE